MIPFERDPEHGGSRGGDGDASEREGTPSPENDWGGRLRGFLDRPDDRPAVRKFHLRPGASETAPARKERWSWLIAPLLLAATGAGVLFVLRGPDGVFGVCFGAVLALGVVWILVSTLFPGRAERNCPACGQRGLERIDPASTCGVRCRLCGWRDESASSFLFAEEEGTFEDIVLRERRSERRRW
jgi:hypothetical protein